MSTGTRPPPRRRPTFTVHLDIAKTIVAVATAALVVYLIVSGASVDVLLLKLAHLRPS